MNFQYTIKSFALTISLFILLASAVVAATPPAEPKGEQIVSFPPDRSMGVLYIRDWGSTGDWQTLGEARGNIVIPYGKVVKLQVSNNAAKDLSPITTLGKVNLQELNLSRTSIGNAELADLATFTSLQELNLSKTQISGAGLIHLKSLKSLQKLNLSYTQTNDAGLAHLKGLDVLKCLYLGHTNVTHAGLAHLEGLKSLQVLYLNNTGVGDEGLKYLARLIRLQKLHLANTQISDAGVIYLKQRLLSECKIAK